MFSIDLSLAKIKRGLRNKTQPYIYIQIQTEVIRVSFHNHDEFEKWLRIALQGQKSDDELKIQFQMNKDILQKFIEKKPEKAEFPGAKLVANPDISDINKK